MLYNNPIAYGTDVRPEQMVDLAATLPNFVAVKESSADVRRVTSLRALLGDRLAILVGVDDLILEGIQAGAVGWIAGLADALPAESVRLAELGAEAGGEGLMVLPPYVYKGDWRETRAHFETVIGATPLPCMLYNNPIAYGTDVLPEHMLDLAAALPNLVAVKESSADVRRVTSLRTLLGDRLAILVGVDDLILEGIQAGAVGWIAGLADALPAESVRLFELAAAGRIAEARAIYDWFMPLLRLDTVPKFVQLIKLVQQETGLGSERVRPPRLPLASPEREAVVDLVRYALARRPALG